MQTTQPAPAAGEDAVALTGATPARRWCGAVARAIGSAHMVAGALEVLALAANAVMGVRTYAGGLLGTRGIVSLLAFVALAATITAPGEPVQVALRRYGGLINLAVRSELYYGLMVLIHLNLAGLNLAIGYGLRRRWPWARRAHVGMMGTCVLLTALHTAAAARDAWPMAEVLRIPQAAALVGATSLLVMASPAMATYFRSGSAPAAAPAGRRRPWWRASVQLLLALLMGADALGILILLTFGPLAEIAAAGAWLVVYL